MSLRPSENADKFVELRNKTKNPSRPNSIQLDQSSCNSRNSFVFSSDLETPSGQSSLLWKQIINHWDEYSNKKGFLKDLIRRGIPKSQRFHVWQLLIRSYDSIHKERFSEIEAKCCANIEQHDHLSIKLFRYLHWYTPSIAKNKYTLDTLTNVWKSLEIYSDGCIKPGRFIIWLSAAMLSDEEFASQVTHGDLFAFLYEFHRHMRSLTPGSSFIPALSYMEKLLESHVPDLSAHCRQHQIFPTSLVFGYFLAVTLDDLSYLSMDHASINKLRFVLTSVTMRLMDMVLSEGKEFFMKFFIAIFKSITINLEECEEPNVTKKELTSAITRLLLQSPEHIFTCAFKISLDEVHVTLALTEYLDPVKQETAEVLSMTEKMFSNEKHYWIKKELFHFTKMSTHAKYYEELCDELKEKLSIADETISSLKSMSGDCSAGSSSGHQALTLIQQLQTELVNLRIREFESSSALRELRDQYRQMEELNSELSKNPRDDVADLQEELIATKLREAEANLALKDLMKRVKDLECQWESRGFKTSSSQKNPSCAQLQEELMALNLREAGNANRTNQLQQQVMELQTKLEIESKKIDRRDNEISLLNQRLKSSLDREKELRVELGILQRKLVDIETKRKEDSMMWRLREMELSALLVEHRHQVASLESQNQELLTATEIGSEQKPGNLTPNQEEMYRLRLQSHKLLQESVTAAFSECPSMLPTPMTNQPPISGFSEINITTPVNGRPAVWKDLPKHIMTESIGPLDELCFQPDDPLITSIYLDPIHSSKVGKSSEEGF